MDVSAVLVTRGDVDLEPALAPILEAGITDLVIWDNSVSPDRQVYGRYEAIGETRYDFVFTQDDDAVCPVAEILAAYTGEGLLVNVAAGEWPWLAWGAVFPRLAPFKAFARYADVHGVRDEDRLRWPDVIFAHVAGWSEVDLGHEDLEWAFADNRMYRQPDHYSTQAAVRARAEALREA